MDNPFLTRAEMLFFQARHADALRTARMGLALFPDDAGLLEIAGHCAAVLDEVDAAEACWARLAALCPDAAEPRNERAILLGRLGRVEEAEAEYRAAIERAPGWASAHSNLGTLLADLARDGEAEACFRHALALDPDSAVAAKNLGQLLLALGRFDEGWALHESRLRETPPVSVPAGAPCRFWQGEPLAGKSVLVLPEQGLGDEIQFSRYLPWLKAQGAARVTLVCRGAQKALFAGLAGVDRLLGLEDEADGLLEAHDYWTVLLSLPFRAATRADSIPAQVPYLHPDPQRQAALAPRLAGAGRKVGLVWQGNPAHSNDRDRSLPDLSILAPLWAVPGLRFFSLQVPAPAQALPGNLPLTDLAPHLHDFADTAALLAGLDLLISVDTSCAHLAGALGVPCWLLLPAWRSDWRWLRERGDSPWYPRTRLFRQPRRGEWGAVVADLGRALAEWAAGPSA
ncbi:tetratricopeptide repeat-containing glycosyltransferase family protein [Zoogloea sp.]|uniref:tetratricopeptide repeat-containing glycosyltransferase family protein n=1 Tax=Zoogloea sp. TaxID=49181 RepID=UPI0031FC883B